MPPVVRLCRPVLSRCEGRLPKRWQFSTRHSIDCAPVFGDQYPYSNPGTPGDGSGYSSAVSEAKGSGTGPLPGNVERNSVSEYAMTSYQLPQKMPDRRISARAQSPTPALPAGKPREEAGIGELLQILKRHKGVILGTMLLVTAGSIAFALGTKPLFMAQSEILLNIRKANIIDTEKDKIIPDIPIASQAASTALRSEVELIQSG